MSTPTPETPTGSTRTPAPTVRVGVSLKMYFSHAQARRWFARVADGLRDRPSSSAVDVFVIPTYLQIPTALEAFAGTGVRVGAQDLSTEDAGAYTGEVSGAELAELGVALAEVGHAERRRLFSETDEVVAAKSAAALRNGLTPVLCIGEDKRSSAVEAAAATTRQMDRALRAAPEGPVVVAYEPVWAIGAPEPAPVAHVGTVARALSDELTSLPGRTGSSVIYGGSAGPGLLTTLGSTVDGIFLGRFAHDPGAFLAVVDEAADLARARVAAP